MTLLPASRWSPAAWDAGPADPDVVPVPAPLSMLLPRHENLWGCQDAERLFGDAPLTPVIWQRWVPRKGVAAYDAEVLGAHLQKPPALVEIDPRALLATQPSLTAAGVRYYLGAAYPLTGLPYADRGQAANRFPVVWEREDGRRLILTGHHRAAAAVLRGEWLAARLLRAADSMARRIDAGTVWVTPRLVLRDRSPWRHWVEAPTAGEAARWLSAGQRVCLQSAADALATLAALGATRREATSQLVFSRTGRLWMMEELETGEQK